MTRTSMSPIFDQRITERFSFDEFQKRTPFPWSGLEGFLTGDAFDTLADQFPPLHYFEYHQGMHRRGQRPHDRYYLALERSMYHPTDPDAPGVIRVEQLSESWRRLISEITEGPFYRRFIQDCLGVDDFHIRFAWHVGQTSNEVSPHVDA